MDVKSVKASDDHRTISDSLKRKRAAQCAALFVSIAGKKLTAHKKRCLRIPTGEDQGFEGIKLCGCKKHYFCSSLLKKYKNFMNSSLPQRLMLHEKGAWRVVPDRLKTLARESFEAKKAITEEVVFQGHRLIFDFLRMVQIDLTNGLQLPLAWIDDFDGCFFPELGQDGYSCKGMEHVKAKEPNGTRKIEVRLEIDLSDEKELKSGGKESGPNFHLMQLETKPMYTVNGDEVGINKKLAHKVVCEKSCLDVLDFGPIKLSKTCRNYTITQKMFLGGFGQHMNANNVDAIYRSPTENISVKNRFILFQKQVGLMGSCRGNANVKYGWLACSMQAAEEILTYGVRDSLMAKFKEPVHGGGLVFRPSNCSKLSARDSDVDEKGLHHLVLCRIIMGNMEVVSPASEQFQARSENFDSGVDSFDNPKLYIVWNKNVNTHVFPEYIVSFRMCQRNKDMLSGNGSKSGLSVITSQTAQLEWTHSHMDSLSSPDKIIDEQASHHDTLRNQKVPASPWMPFRLLFAAITDKISSEDKELVDQYYSEYQRKKTSRGELIRHLREVVGDKLLKSTIMSLQQKPLIPRQRSAEKMEPVSGLTSGNAKGM